MFVEAIDDVRLLGEEQRHHLTRVLRLRNGDAVVTTDGRGRLQPCVLDGDCLRPDGDAQQLARPEPDIGVIQAIPSGRKLDETTRMLAEIGVAWLQPVSSQHANAFARDDRSRQRRLERLETIAVSALEQSRSGWRMAVRAPCPLAVAVEGIEGLLVLEPSARERLVDHVGDAPVTLAVGPESGWSAHDHEAMEHGVAVRLGPEVLRTEHAAVAAVAAILARTGRW